jgi:hypothetical protein
MLALSPSQDLDGTTRRRTGDAVVLVASLAAPAVVFRPVSFQVPSSSWIFTCVPSGRPLMSTTPHVGIFGDLSCEWLLYRPS